MKKLKRDEQYSRLVRLGLKKAENMFNPFTTIISLVLCLIAIWVITNGVTKVMKYEVKATRLMEKKIIHDTVRVETKVKVNDCDTIYMIDGKPYKKANN